MTDTPTISLSWVGDRYLRVTVGTGTGLQDHLRVRAAWQRLLDARLSGVRDVTPAYASLLISFDAATLDPGRAIDSINGLLGDLGTPGAAADQRIVEIPVCYEGECAPDLGEVATLCGLKPDEVVSLHSGAEYLVHFIGFAPGFPYLGGLPAQLNTPRLDAPRPRIPIGSVGIAGDQTGIYPHASPGGWRLIGRTPRRLFNPTRTPPTLLLMGDRVKFVPISLDEFRRLTSPRSGAEGGA